MKVKNVKYETATVRNRVQATWKKNQLQYSGEVLLSPSTDEAFQIVLALSPSFIAMAIKMRRQMEHSTTSFALIEWDRWALIRTNWASRLARGVSNGLNGNFLQFWRRIDIRAYVSVETIHFYFHHFNLAFVDRKGWKCNLQCIAMAWWWWGWVCWDKRLLHKLLLASSAKILILSYDCELDNITLCLSAFLSIIASNHLIQKDIVEEKKKDIELFILVRGGAFKATLASDQ